MVKQAKLIENLVGALVFLIALATFFFTIAPTVSFWDCGEYIAASYTLGIPHPPGNPLYILVARIFTIIFFWTQQVAFRINLLSVVTAAVTAFFLYKIIVFSMKDWFGELDERWKIATVSISGFVGALFGVFNYTFWFSAVESSVYIPAILTIVLNVYIVLIWSKSKEENRDRYLILFAYLAFLGIGLHMMAMFALMPIFLYILLVDKTKLTDWRLWGVALLLGSIVYSMAAFFFVVPVLLVMSAIYGFVPQKEAKIISPFVGAITLFVMFKLLVTPENSDDIGMITLVSITLIIFSVVNAASNDRDCEKKWKFAFLIVLFSLLGFSVHAYIPIRSSLEPIIDENHPVVEMKNGKLEWDAFRGFLERKQYGSESMITRMFHRRGALGTQFGVDSHMGYGGFHITQFFHFGESIVSDRTADDRNSILGENNFFKRSWILLIYLIPTFFMLWGWKYWFEKDRNKAILFVSLFLITTVAMVLYMNFSDGKHSEKAEYEHWVNAGKPGPMPTVHREVRERDYFFTPGFMFFGLWIGLAAGALLHRSFTSKNKIDRKFAQVLAVLFCASPALPFVQNYKENNRANDWIPYDYAYNLLMSCEKDGIIFTNGDNDTFPLWFLQEAEGIRKDVRVVNLSLANTSWYIKQLKRLEPKAPISYSESDIETGRVAHQRNPLKNPTKYSLPEAKIDIILPSPDELPIWRIQDLLVVNIIDANAWKKPIYFSSTVSDDNMMGFSPYLKFEGMVSRVMNTPVESSDYINFDRTKLLLDEIYQFRSLGDNSTPMSETARRMMYNYSAVFIQYSHGLRSKLARIKRQINNIDNQITSADIAKADFTGIKQTFETQKDSLVSAHKEVLEEIINKLDKCVALMPWDERPRGFRHEFLMEQELYDLAGKRLDEALKIEPNNRYYLRWKEDLDRRG
ncbi:MAG: DUF2723 domain-containing protein [Chitinispirillales bacterium]|jgi:hypothetical protein|nr:DUF2723 domain-containing protein [Chitinispirillales bacterium]